MLWNALFRAPLSNISDLTWTSKIWAPGWCTWRPLFCDPSFYCLPTHPPTQAPTRCAFHNTRFWDFGADWLLCTSCVPPSGAHWHSLRHTTGQLVHGFKNWNILVLVLVIFQHNMYVDLGKFLKCDILLVQHILWSGQVFGSYLRWNQAAPPPICLFATIA